MRKSRLWVVLLLVVLGSLIIYSWDYGLGSTWIAFYSLLYALGVHSHRSHFTWLISCKFCVGATASQIWDLSGNNDSSVNVFLFTCYCIIYLWNSWDCLDRARFSWQCFYLFNYPLSCCYFYHFPGRKERRAGYSC